MEKGKPLFAPFEEPFVAGTSKLSPTTHRLCKLEGGTILFCHRGWAQLTIDLKQYEIVENTQVVILPGSVVSIDGTGDHFNASYFGFSGEMFREACLRLDPPFFRFLKENPCYTLPQENTKAINGLMHATAAIYADRENRFRAQIVKNHLQSFLLDIYDKCHRFFTRKQIEGGNRQVEIFKKFIGLVHEHCTSQREVTFYANELCISTKYLAGISRNITGHPAKKIIDSHTILEIKVLLQSTELSIQEIADRLGFPDQSYLGRYFKRHEGISPKDYQSQYTL